MKIIKALSIIVVVLALLMGVIGYGFTSYALDNRSFIARELSSQEFSDDTADERDAYLASFTEDAYIESYDGLRLHAYQDFNESSDVYVLLMHGYKAGPFTMSIYAEHYRELGFNIIVPDERAQGRSEGRYITMGYKEKIDLVSWLDYILSVEPDARIILHGVSMGAATVMMATGGELPENVVCAVEDCGFTSAWDVFASVLKTGFHLPTFPILNATEVVTRLVAGFTLHEADALSAVSRSTTPTLFIHGSADTFVPFSMLDVLYEAASCPKEKLVIEGAAHGLAAKTDPELYFTVLDRFVFSYL